MQVSMSVNGKPITLDLQNYFNKKENQFSPASEIQANDKVKVLGIVWDTKVII